MSKDGSAGRERGSRTPSDCIYVDRAICGLPTALKPLEGDLGAEVALLAACLSCETFRDHISARISDTLTGKRLGKFERAILLELANLPPLFRSYRMELVTAEPNDPSSLNKAFRRLHEFGLADVDQYSIQLTPLGWAIITAFREELEHDKAIRWSTFAKKFETTPKKFLKFIALDSVKTNFRYDALREVIERLEQ